MQRHLLQLFQAPSNVFVNNAAGFMSYQSLMKLKEVAGCRVLYKLMTMNRMRLAEHNERIRKVSGDSFGERSGRRGFSCQLIQTQERNKVDMKLPMADTSFKRP
nr:unnamed protein product [Brassica oleracea]